MADTTKVILLKGDKRNPESSEHIIKFPGGSIAVARTSDNEYWAHIEVNKRELLEDEVRGSKFGEITDTRLDYENGDILEIENADQMLHLAVRIRTSTEKGE